MNSICFTRFAKSIIFCCLCSLTTFAQNKQEIVTNPLVVSMVKAGLDNTIIVTKINNSETKFDVSVNALTQLKKQGVSNEIIAAMVAKGSESAPAPVHDTKATASKVSKNASKQLQNINHPYALNPSDNATMATEKAIAEYKAKKIAMGYGGVNYQYELTGAKSAVRVSSAGEVSFLIQTAGNALPELVLYKASSAGGKRIALVGKFKTMSADALQSGKDAVTYNTASEGNNVYRLTPSVKLGPGEYMFVPKSASLTTTSTDVYAFGID